MPQIFGAPTASDGIMMGHQGMRYSLVSREVIAGSIEIVAGGMNHDGILAFGGCDKNMPGCIMAMARLNVPTVFVYGGTLDSPAWGNKSLSQKREGAAREARPAASQPMRKRVSQIRGLPG